MEDRVAIELENGRTIWLPASEAEKYPSEQEKRRAGGKGPRYNELLSGLQSRMKELSRQRR